MSSELFEPMNKKYISKECFVKRKGIKNFANNIAMLYQRHILGFLFATTYYTLWCTSHLQQDNTVSHTGKATADLTRCSSWTTRITHHGLPCQFARLYLDSIDLDVLAWNNCSTFVVLIYLIFHALQKPQKMYRPPRLNEFWTVCQ